MVLGMHPGATWRRCDFEIHSPRDPQWQGPPNLPGGDQQSEDARAAWADEFVAVCARKGLAAIALTDHHDCVLARYVAAAIERAGRTDEIWLFPGLEITCDDSTQCIILFDVAGYDIHTRLFGGILRDQHIPDRDAAKSPQALSCGHNIIEFMNHVLSDPYLKKRSVMIAHAGNDNAYKTVIRRGMNARFRDLPCDGVYAADSRDSLKDSTIDKIRGAVPEWGDRRRGLLLTGDSRDSSFTMLGENGCWIRLGEPTAEAIRQALLADQARVAYEQPRVPSQRIISATISSVLCGERFCVSFNDGFTALIGGRGAGKSAILEYLRFGLGRSAIDMPLGDGSRYERERALVSETLPGGVVQVVLERDGVIETWSRSTDAIDTISVVTGDGAEESLRIGEAQQRFRARAYYQKQLSTLVTDRSTALEQITGIAAAEFLDERRGAETEVEAMRRALMQKVQLMEEYWLAEAAVEAASASVGDVRRRVSATRSCLQTAGLSQEDQETIDQAPVYERGKNYATQMKENIQLAHNNIKSVKEDLLLVDLSSYGGLSEFEELAGLAREAERARGRIFSLLETAEAELVHLQAVLDLAEAGFRTRSETFRLGYAKAMAQQAALRQQVEDLERVNHELADAEAKERTANERLRALQHAPEQMARSKDLLDAALRRRRLILQRSVQRIEEISAGALKASVEGEVGPMQHFEALNAILEGSGVRSREARCRDIVMSRNRSWREIGDSLLSVFEHKAKAPSASLNESVRQRLRLVFGDLTDGWAGEIYARLDAAKIGACLAACADDFIEFRYLDRDRYIEFDKASPGQQASALLRLLLNQEAGTLMIDQPEDDLDNRVIMEIAKMLQTTKQNRQLIFATHNANLVVNGDADKIVALVPGPDEGVGIAMAPRIAVEVDGAIETPGIREVVTETMEGGRRAFELRGRKYAFRS